MLFFASCEEESAFMPSDNVPCYTILVSTDDTPSTRAHYEETGEKIIVSWDKGDRIKLKNAYGEYDFIFRTMVGNNGEFFHYGEIPDSASWTGTVSYGNPLDENLLIQTQEKNNKCSEYLVGEATGIVLKRNSKPTVSLLPKLGDQDMDMSLLHIQTTSPGMFIGTSLMKIKGLDKINKEKEYLVNLGSNPKYVFADQGDTLDIYVAVPAGFSISNNQKIEFYFYAYNEETGTSEGGDEYRYIMKCTRDISVSKNEVLKMPLPDNAKNILHITGKAPGEIPAGSMLVIEGWKQDAKESFPVQIDKDGDIDMYVTMPDLAKITNETSLKIYIYAYDNVTGKWETGDEYHYYFEYPGASNSAIVNIQLPDQPTHIAIQLGLSVKWATMNIGATSDQPGEASFGKYLPWGMTEEHFEFAWEDPNLSKLYRKTNVELKAVFGNGFSGSIQGITPRKYMGDTYGDPATCLWGDDWVIPTRNQIKELMDQMEITKVQGAKFTNWVEWANNVVIPHVKTNGCYVYGKDSYSNKKIWFPAAGGVHSEKRGTPESPASNDGCNGVYMTATTASTNPGKQPSCYVFMFNGAKKNGSVGNYSLGCNDGSVYNFDTRIHGCSVRPIRKP